MTGVIKELDYHGRPPLIKIESEKRLLTVLIAPRSRMEFRDVTEDMLQPGKTVSVVAYPHRKTPNELRAETLTIGKTTTDLR